MRVFLTGASGFVGSFLLPRLLDRGHDVAALHQPGFDDSRIRAHLARVHIIAGDLADLDAYRDPIADFAPDAMVHLAWDGVAGSARNDPRQTYNLPATVNLLALGGELRVKHWLGLGSQAEYGPHSAALDEQTPTRPTTLYGITKLAACLATERLCEQYGIRFAWLRLFSSYGPTDHPTWMIPSLILSLLRRERPALTAGEQLWDYIYVEDVAEALYSVLTTSSASGVYNLGSGRAIPLRQLVEQIRDYVDVTLPLGFGEVASRPDQVMHLEADTTRLHQATGWAPRVELAVGMERTVRWYREHQDQYRDR